MMPTQKLRSQQPIGGKGISDAPIHCIGVCPEGARRERNVTPSSADVLYYVFTNAIVMIRRTSNFNLYKNDS